jgi:siroheme synthase
LNWAAVTPETTIAIYMPGTHYGEVAARLIENGLSPETPCVVVSQASRAEQQVRWSSIAALSSEAQLPAPSILLVGRVASQVASHVTSQVEAQAFDGWGTRLAPEAFLFSTEGGLRLDELKKN